MGNAVTRQLDDTGTIRLTGEPVVVDDLNTASKNDLIRAELIGIPAALIVLLLVFGTPIVAILPLIMGLVTFVFGAGVLYFVVGQQELSIFVLNAVAMISLALGIDFSLLYVNRFREERQDGQSIRAKQRFARSRRQGARFYFRGFVCSSDLPDCY
ncbi:MMPL family transporter [Exiguobacterium sp. SL14]|nr:MMPL family transporter [Exiguobacterium sp. SL14]MCY1689686.1 MMPL family transporter [Exiguobacterium sp. SL14]